MKLFETSAAVLAAAADGGRVQRGCTAGGGGGKRKRVLEEGEALKTKPKEGSNKVKNRKSSQLKKCNNKINKSGNVEKHLV